MVESARLLSPADVAVCSHWLEGRTGVLSLDLEGDYNGTERNGLARVSDFLHWTRDLELPLTVYVEGRLFEQRPDLCDALLEAGADVQLHCYDHTRGGDSAADLLRGIAAYTDFVGDRPLGYRAFSYRLTPELYRILKGEGVAWDSSVLPAPGFGGNPAWGREAGDYFCLDEALLEFPVGTWQGLRYPMTQSYRGLLKPPLEWLLERLGSRPQLLIYVLHMVDMVWTGNLWRSPLPLLLKGGYAYYWGLSRRDRFDEVGRFIGRLRNDGYSFVTTGELYRRHLAGNVDRGSGRAA